MSDYDNLMRLCKLTTITIYFGRVMVVNLKAAQEKLYTHFLSLSHTVKAQGFVMLKRTLVSRCMRSMLFKCSRYPSNTDHLMGLTKNYRRDL